jgi:hypothetical protein
MEVSVCIAIAVVVNTNAGTRKEQKGRKARNRIGGEEQ